MFLYKREGTAIAVVASLVLITFLLYLLNVLGAWTSIYPVPQLVVSGALAIYVGRSFLNNAESSSPVNAPGMPFGTVTKREYNSRAGSTGFFLYVVGGLLILLALLSVVFSFDIGWASWIAAAVALALLVYAVACVRQYR